jgi:hypothetical protein
MAKVISSISLTGGSSSYDGARIVYVDTVDPVTATIFDINNPPITNNDSLKKNVKYVYAGIDSSIWVYNSENDEYTTDESESLSNFYITDTNDDAGGIKTGSITKRGELAIDSEVNEVSGLVLKQLPNQASASYEIITPDIGVVPPYLFPKGCMGNDDFYYIPVAPGLRKVNITTGAIVDFSTFPGDPTAVCLGLDGFLYALASTTIYKINQTTGAVVSTVYSGGALSNSNSIIYASDNNLYLGFHVSYQGIGKVTLSGDIYLYPTVNGECYYITQGNDGFLYCHSIDKIYKSTLDGIVSPFITLESTAIYASPDNFIYTYSNSLGILYKISYLGDIIEINIAVHSSMEAIAQSQDGTFYYNDNDDVGRITLSSNKVLKTDELGNVIKTTYLEDVQYALASEVDTDLSGKEDKINKGIPLGYAPLDINNKVPLVHINDALLGNVNYQGLWNQGTNVPNLDVVQAKGYYFICSGLTETTRYGHKFNTGDWIISNGVTWDKVDNTDAVSSVFGRTGNIIATNGDYNTGLVTEVANKNYQTDNQKLFNDATSSIQTQLNNKANDIDVLHKLGNLSETITGIKSIINSSDPAISSFEFINNFNGGLSNATNAPFRIINNQYGIGGHVENKLNGIGLYILNETTGENLRLHRNLAATGDFLTWKSTGINYGKIDYLGNITTSSFIKTGGSAIQYLMADGSTSTLTNPVTGTGVSGQVSFWNSSNVQSGDSSFIWDNTNKRLVLGSFTNAIGLLALKLGTTSTYDLLNQEDSSITFSNVGSGSSSPTITSKTTTGGGLRIITGTNDTNGSFDMNFDIRMSNNGDFTTLTGSGFRWTRGGSIRLMELARTGNLGINVVPTTTATDKLQVNGNITANVGTTATHVVVKSQLDLKADLASPAFTGSPTSPTALAGTNTTQIATTAFVTGAISTADAGNVKITGLQTITGNKIFETGANSVAVTINNTGSSAQGFRITNSSTGAGMISYGLTGSTGDVYQGGLNAVATFRVNKEGDITGNMLTLTGVLKLKAYTVGTLPAGTVGDMAYVTDATAPTYNGTLTGGGAVKIPVFYDGTAWKAH